ncbi:hypothetical protein HZF24_02170 [Sedimentibacter hydroxybenzoicus DSM 7310]|uniref:Uncharacterized protein n=1 Tax=Sedimentibacter hydroxybenzoicus DSM 7310 TaxID=1123245 RepID=A0A974BH11_SEDHY|nr:hypothetical protein [Sedimentibacter hydroxybenzoicus]NYB72943.1 hypothetical protein [Sedimentibacter hydroxybenzoicus DSM 7310]
MHHKPYYVKNLIKKLEANVGYIDVNTSTGLGAIPIGNAEVSVYVWNEQEGETLIRTFTTDESGKAPRIELPVLLSNIDLSGEGRTQYHLVVRAPNYHTVIIINVEIYPNIANQFNVNLTPLRPDETHRDERVDIPIQTKNK